MTDGMTYERPLHGVSITQDADGLTTIRGPGWHHTGLIHGQRILLGHDGGEHWNGSHCLCGNVWPCPDYSPAQ